MQRRSAVSFLGLCAIHGLAVLAGPGSAFAADCAAPAVEVEAQIQERWPEIEEHLVQALKARQDIDACAQVRLRARERETVVEVELPDGRHAARPVSNREDVVPAIEALLLVPAPLPSPAIEAPVKPVPEPTTRLSLSKPLASVPTPAATARARDHAPPQTSDRAASTNEPELRSGTYVELSVITAARVGDGQWSVGLGVLSFVELERWLIGFEGRADHYQRIEGDPGSAALELAALAGRRFQLQERAIDVVVGPALAVLAGTSVTQVAVSNELASGADSAVPAPLPRSDEPVAIDPRLFASARLSFGMRSVLRTFVGCEGSFAPVQAIGGVHGAYAQGTLQLPLWTLGLVLGATAGTL